MGRTIAEVVEPKGKNFKTYIEGETYFITWAIGHLLELAQPENYNPKFKKWSIHDLPIIPSEFKLIPSKNTREQLKVIEGLASQSQLIINACDAGREGQLIFHYIYKHLRLTQPVQRLWVSDLTHATIRQGFQNLKSEYEYENLTRAAKSRSEADWLVGINGTRALTTKCNTLLSVGRVQTPVLALIYDRQKEIENFVSETYFDIMGHFKQGSVKYTGKWQGKRILDLKQATTIAEKVRAKTGRILNFETKETKEYPPKLFDLTLLQREANSRFHFSAKKTLDIAQALYEKHKVISYPRTNSNFVTEQNILQMHSVLHSLKGTDYDKWITLANQSLVHQKNRTICNPDKVEDHHAILPTNKKAGKLTSDEQKLYDLIVRRFLSHFFPPAEFRTHVIDTEVEQEMFKTQMRQLNIEGWKVIYSDWDKKSKQTSSKEEDWLEIKGSFSLDQAKEVCCLEGKVEQKKTKPPSSYTEGTLLKAMESAGKQVEDEELRESMKDSGLGTPATRASIIERLKQVGYIQLEKRKISLTSKGRGAIDLLREAGIELLTSPEMTGQWEKRLTDISKGKASEIPFLERIEAFTLFIVNQVKKEDLKVEHLSLATVQSKEMKEEPIPCPREGCTGQIIAGKKGFGCSRYKEGCSFVIWKTTFGKNLTPKMVKDLIVKGKTGKLKFKSKNGHPYEAKMILNDKNTGQVKLEFSN